MEIGVEHGSNTSPEMTADEIELLDFTKKALEKLRDTAWTMGGMYSPAYFLAEQEGLADSSAPLSGHVHAVRTRLDEAIALIEKLSAISSDDAAAETEVSGIENS